MIMEMKVNDRMRCLYVIHCLSDHEKIIYDYDVNIIQISIIYFDISVN